MNEDRYIRGVYAKDYAGRFLSLGSWESITDPLIEAGWGGVIVDHNAFEKIPGHESQDVKYLHGVLQPDPHYVLVERNYWARAITLREVLDNFSGPFDAMIVNVPSFGRDIVCCDATWALWPKVICVNAEGREQEISNLTAEHSYSVTRIERGAMILVQGGK